MYQTNEGEVVEMWTFIQDQMLGMKWLNGLISRFLGLLGLDTGTKIGASVQFFIYDTIKITALLCVLIFLIAFITDTYAYIGGCLIGNHKLISISPKKTVEGTLVGSLMGIVIGSVHYNLAIGGLGISSIIMVCLFLI